MFDATRRILLLFVGFTIPMQSMGTFRVGGYPLGPNKIATGLLLILAVVAWGVTGRGVPWNRKHAWVIVFAVSVVAAGLSALLTEGLPASRVAILWSSYAAVLIFSFLLPYAVRAPRDLSLLLGGLVLGAVTTIVGGLGGAEDLAAGRFAGTEVNPNNLAAGLVVALPVMFAFLFSSPSMLRKVFFLLASVLALGGIVLSVSRAAMLSLVGMWGLWALYFRRLDTLRYFVPTVILAIGVLVLAPQSFYERMGTIAPQEAQQESSAQKRLLMDYWAARAMLENPILGVGLYKTGEFANRRDPRIGRGHAVHHAYLQVGAEFGLLGLVPMIMFTVLTWLDYSLVRRTARAPDLRRDPALRLFAWWATFLQIAFFGVVIFAQFHPTTRDKSFWLLIGLSSALVAMTRDRVRELRGAAASPAVETGHGTPGTGWEPQPARQGPL